ncbi:MAG: GUN4 domain-containing protein [Cyanobacteria bacterium P01_A01_bin.80]
MTPQSESDFQFDVFLCHNSKDKSEVKQIGEQLKQQRLKPWLDEWEFRPGLPWQRELGRQIGHIKSAAVFVGSSGYGPWQEHELDAFLREFVKRQCPVIPVLLPTAPQQPQLPIFLQSFHWVDFRQREPEPMGQLIWGITGIKPESKQINSVIEAQIKQEKNLTIEEKINYQFLEDLLKTENFQEADKQTKNILLFSLEKKIDEGLGKKEIRSLSSDILFTIDELWMKYSNQKFGLSKQKSIWEDLLLPQKGFMSLLSCFKKNKPNNSDKDNWYQFARDIGWYHTNPRTGRKEWIPYASLDFTFNAPEGCFPYFRNWWEVMGFNQHDPGRCIALMEKIDKFYNLSN